MRRSMAVLAPAYSSSRMARDYVEQYYLGAAAQCRHRAANKGEAARTMRQWELRLRRHWSALHIGETSLSTKDGSWNFSVPVYLGEVPPEDVAVQLYANEHDGKAMLIADMRRGEPLIGTANGHSYAGTASADRPAEEYTVRVIPRHSGVRVPAELPLILWQK
jgi:starch phosphorylase